jgi:hypothetical protein
MNPEVPTRYIRDNFEPDDRLAVVLIHKETEHVIQRVATAERIAEPGFQAWLRHHNAHRYEVYLSMNALYEDARGRTKDDVAVIRHIYLDFDRDGTRKVQALIDRKDIPQLNYLVNSSSGKWQVVWKVEGFEKEQAESLQCSLVQELGADPAVTDSSRVLRLPGFYNHKYARPFYVRAEARASETYRPEHFPQFPAGGRVLREREPGIPRRVSRPPGSSISQSERDWAYAKRALTRGEVPATVVDAIARYRAGQKYDVQDYAERTVLKAQAELQRTITLQGDGERQR